MARILVVDDDAGVRGLVSAILEFEGHEVQTAVNGLLALDQVEREMPDLIVLDIAMPEMNGWRFLEELYHRGLRDRTRVILASGQLDDAARELGQRSSIRHFLPKPFEPDELVEIVRESLQRAPDELIVKKDRRGELARLLSVVDRVAR